MVSSKVCVSGLVCHIPVQCLVMTWPRCKPLAWCTPLAGMVCVQVDRLMQTCERKQPWAVLYSKCKGWGPLKHVLHQHLQEEKSKKQKVRQGVDSLLVCETKNVRM